MGNKKRPTKRTRWALKEDDPSTRDLPDEDLISHVIGDERRADTDKPLLRIVARGQRRNVAN
jgi:hypothetical protein